MQDRNGSANTPPVVIVGAGPVGLVSALYLHWLGVPFVVLEEDSDVSTAAKAGTLTPRSLEIFSQLGAIDDLLKEGLRLDVVDLVERRKNRVLMRMPFHEMGGETSYPFTINLPQSDYERILLDHVQRSDIGEVRFEQRVVGLEQDEAGCRLTVETPNGTETLEGSYVLACDGGRSEIRRQLGIKHEGKTYPEKFALIDIEADLDSDTERKPSHLSYIFDPQEWLILVRQPHMWRVLWPIPPEAEEPDTPEVQRKLRLAVGDRPVNILGVITYKVHHRVAQQWKVGRTFLLGDAAHLITPIGGLGASTGIMDANNLAWKLAWVAHGLADDSLLDTYEDERRPIAEFIASGLADRNRSIMNMQNPIKRAVRDATLLAIQRFRAHRWSIAYTRSLLGTSYNRESREPQGMVGKILESVLPDTSPQVRAGDRVPDGNLFGPDGRRHTLHELVSVAFVAFTFDDVRNRPRVTPSEEQSPLLRHYIISPFDAPHDTGLRDRTFWDIGSTITRRFDAEPGTTFLVRPDGHVAAVEPPGGRSARSLYEEYVGRSRSRENITEEDRMLSGSQS
jgi:3-(3-hydroxy-phenyl)propionate hydroxylase